MLLKRKVQPILGFVQLLLSEVWVFRMGWLYYQYHYTDLLFAFRYPDWLLFLNIGLGLLNTYLGYRVLTGRLAILRSYVLMLCLIVLGSLLNLSYTYL